MVDAWHKGSERKGKLSESNWCEFIENSRRQEHGTLSEKAYQELLAMQELVHWVDAGEGDSRYPTTEDDIETSVAIKAALKDLCLGYDKYLDTIKTAGEEKAKKRAKTENKDNQSRNLERFVLAFLVSTTCFFRVYFAFMC